MHDAVRLVGLYRMTSDVLLNCGYAPFTGWIHFLIIIIGDERVCDDTID